MASKHLKMMQHNIQSIRPSDTREGLQYYMATQNIQVAILQEIWLKEKETFKLKNFSMFSKRRVEGHGGVGVLVRADLKGKQIKMPDLEWIEAVGVRIVDGSVPVSIFSVYIPDKNNRTAIAELETLFGWMDQVNGEIVVGGDFNAHNTSWSPEFKDCARGRRLLELIMDSKLILLNDGSPTMVARVDERRSAIDLTLATSGIARKTKWKVVQEEFGSAHLTVEIDVDTKIPVVLSKKKMINSEKLIEALNGIRPQFLYNPQEMQEIFEGALEEASYVVKNKKANYLKKWWTPKIGELYDEKREALRNFNAHKSRSAQLEWKKKRAIYKREARKEKRRYTTELSRNIDENTPAKHMWNIVKGIDTALSGESRRNISLSTEKGQEFMDFYFGDKKKEVNCPETSMAEEFEAYGSAIQEAEVFKVLKKKKLHSAPGEDGMSYRILKGLNLDMKAKVAEMLNEVFLTEEIPERWRKTRIKPIPKLNADPELVSSKRPISLMNVNLKIINAVVKERMEEIVEIKGVLPEGSFGFRKNRSASTCVNYVVNSVKEAKAAKLECLVTFLDISKAFDCVNTTKLLEILAKMGFPQKLVSWCHTFLKRRVLVLDTQDGQIEMEVTEGLAQGCSTSPTFFNCYTAGLHTLNNENCEMVQFADDLAVIATGRSLEEAEANLNAFLDKLVWLLEELELKVNPAKCAVIPFTRKRTDHLRIKLKGHKLELVNTHKYLGFTLDRELTHRKHIEEVVRQAAKKIPLLKMLAGKRSEANPLTVMKIGNAIVRSRLDYGATVYGSAAETNLRKIQVIQNAAIRAAMGYLKTTPVHVMISETGQVSMAVRRKALTKREMIKSVFHQDPLARFIQKTLDTDESNGSFLTTTAWENADIVAQTYPKDKSMAELLRRRRFGGIDLHQVIKAKLEGMDQRKEDMAAEQWRAVVAELTNNKYREYTKIYTDGSKIAEGTALAFYDERKDLSQGGKVNNNTTITNAELMAIKEAVDWSSNQKYDKTLILTDSASGCAILRNTKKIVNNSVASEIYKLLTKEEHKHTRIQWIPSHQGIKGNEKADEKAKECASGPQNIFNTFRWTTQSK